VKIAAINLEVGIYKKLLYFFNWEFLFFQEKMEKFVVENADSQTYYENAILEVPRDSIELEKYLNSSLIHFAICLHLF
jgi:hypothetical protein